MQFAALNRDNATDIVSVNRDVWVINDGALYRHITVIYFNNFSIFRMLIYLNIRYLDRQKSHTIQPPFCRSYHLNVENKMELKLKYITK